MSEFLPWENKSHGGVDPFLKLLYDISQEIKEEHFKDLLNLCEKQVPRAKSVNTPFDLFILLRDKQEITEETTKFLADILCTVGLNNLARRLEDYHPKRGRIAEHFPPPDENLDTSKISGLLKDTYKTAYSKIKPISWNEQVHLDLNSLYTHIDVVKIERGSQKTRETVEDIHDVFDRSSTERQARRIRLEGAPAMGKSTLCMRMAYDWANGRLVQFKLLFLLQMRHVRNKTVIREILSQLLPKDVKVGEKALSKYIQEHEESILFLFDGLNEMKDSRLRDSEFPEIISGNRLKHATVVITTRPHECDQYLKDCDLHLIAEGFAEERTKEYVEKFFSPNANARKTLLEELIEMKRKKNDSVLNDLLRNPLHISYLCILWEDYIARGIQHFPTTVTGLYDDILICICKRYAAKAELQSKENVMHTDITEAVDNLAKDSYKAYTAGRYFFDMSDISSEISLELGLLVRDMGPSRTSPRKLCFFYHRTWLEYFAAYHIAKLPDSPNYIEYMQMCRSSKKYSLLRFIAGFLKGDDVLGFFEELRNWVEEEREKYTVHHFRDSCYPEAIITCFECLLETNRDEECFEKIATSLPKSLVYIGHKAVIYPSQLPTTHLMTSYVDKSTCMFEENCGIFDIVDILKLQEKITNGEPLTRAFFHFHQSSDVILLCEELKAQSVKLSFLALDVAQLGDELALDSVTAMISNAKIKSLMVVFRPLEGYGDMHLHGLSQSDEYLVNLATQAAYNSTLDHLEIIPCLGERRRLTFPSAFFERLMKGGPRKVSLWISDTLNENRGEALCNFIQHCQVTDSIKLVLSHGGTNLSQNLSKNLMQAVEYSSHCLKSLEIFFDSCGYDYKLAKSLSTNKTLDHIGIGPVTHDTVPQMCELIRENAFMRSLCFCMSNYNAETLKSIYESLLANDTLRELVVRCRYFGDSAKQKDFPQLCFMAQSLHVSELKEVVECFVKPISRKMKNNECSLESLKFILGIWGRVHGNNEVYQDLLTSDAYDTNIDILDVRPPETGIVRVTFSCKRQDHD